MARAGDIVSPHSWFAGRRPPFMDNFALPVESKQAALLDRLAQLPIGLSEWAVHPGIDTEEVRALDDGLPVRVSDLAFLLSREAHEMIETEGVTLIDYRQMQQAWNHVGSG